MAIPGRGDLLQRLTTAARRLPGADIAEQALREVEARALIELKQRLATVTDDDAAAAPASLAGRFAERMTAADRQDRDAAERELFHRILDQLLNDELRLLGALSDGEAVAMIHAGIGPPVDPLGQQLARNVTALGKQAGLKLPEMAARYVGHMRELGLCASRPEDKALDVRYQILEGDRQIRDLATGRKLPTGQRLRVIRRTLVISELGARFWAACQDR